jgi:hypothetical protein
VRFNCYYLTVVEDSDMKKLRSTVVDDNHEIERWVYQLMTRARKWYHQSRQSKSFLSVVSGFADAFTILLMFFSLSSSQFSRSSSTQRINDCHEMYRLRIIIQQQQLFSTFSIHLCRYRSLTSSLRSSTRIFSLRSRSFCRTSLNEHVVKLVNKSETSIRTIQSSIR